MSSNDDDELAPLRGLLDSVLDRLEALESKVGIENAARKRTTRASTGEGRRSKSATTNDQDDGSLPPALLAYDEHVQNSVIPFANACKDLGPELGQVGQYIVDAWAGIRTVVLLGTKCKKPPLSNPTATVIQPYLQPTQEAISKIRLLRLDRKYDFHMKAIMEMLVCASWVVVTPPPTSPTNFVKETVGSSDFWSNKIRKEYKGKDDRQIKFCDALKKLILDLAAYVKEYHLSGLAWNPRGVDVKDVGDLTTSKKDDASVKTKDEQASATTGAGAAAGAKQEAAAAADGDGGGLVNVFDELSKRRSADGSSAATGLKKVTKDQQTRRKEYKKTPAGAPILVAEKRTTSSTKVVHTTLQKKTAAPPVCQYQERGHKWTIENQTKDTNPNGVCNVTIKDPKEQAYIYKCDGATVILTGKVKSVILDGCTKCSVVFDTAISACEIVNCKSVQIQTRGLCPSFSIDKTDGCLIYLSKETIGLSNFVTSKSTEMNVNYPDDNGDVKEVPIPEQFVHKLVNGSITSEVSDLYH